MKLTIERLILLRCLGHIQNIVERRNTIPILSNVRMEATSGQLKLHATDMDLDVVESVEAKVDAEGATTVPAHILYDITRKLPEGSEVELTTSGGGQMFLSSGRSEFTLSCLSPDEFPSMGGDDFNHSFSLESKSLRSLIDRTKFAISNEETRYYLNGIYFHRANNGKFEVLRTVSTDGHRLASSEIKLPSGAENIPGVIVPRKTVIELRKLIDEFDEEIKLSLTETKIRFEFGDIVVTSKLIDGTFPDYERVIPKENDKEFEVNSRILSSAVDRVSAISNEKSRAIKLSVEESKLILSASSPGHGSAVEEIEIDYKDEGAEIGFNATYLMDIMRQIEGGNVQVSFFDSASPTILREVGDGSAIFVLMPMRV